MHYMAITIAVSNIVFCLIGIFLLSQLIFRMLMGIIYKKHAPFVSIPREALALLDTIGELRAGEVVYDLGCGNGGVLMYLADRSPQASYIGIEYDIVPYLIAKIRTKRYKNITIRLKNFFKEDLSNADVIVMYLYPGLMDVLLGKLEAELKQGARLYSFDFAFAEKEPVHVEYGNRRTAARGERLLTFRF